MTGCAAGRLFLHDLVRQLVDGVGGAGEMRGQHFPHLADGEDDGAIEILVFEMCPHVVHQFFPKLFTAFLVDADVADHGIFLFSGRNKDQNSVAIGGPLHSELKELFFRPGQGVAFKLPALNKNPYLPGTFSFRLLNRLDDAVVIEAAKKTMRPHPITSCRWIRHHRSYLHRN
jgi:hypothetical protein